MTQATQKGLSRLRRFLDSEGVSYHLIHHSRDFQAAQAAADTETPADTFAKTVFVWIDGEPAMAVVPATASVALSRLRRALGAENVRLAREPDLQELCPDCEPGAAPPFGNLYDLPVYVSPRLAQREEITFNGGSHEDALRMKYCDFERLVHPRVVSLAHHDG